MKSMERMVSEKMTPGPGPDAEAQLAVSVVVPTCGRAELLNRCLQALAEQDLPVASYEIIVVDDGPSAQTEEIVAGWTARMAPRGLAIRYIANHGPHGPAAARNRGWR